MTRSLKARFVLDLTGNLRSEASRFGSAFSRLGDRGERELGRVGRAAAAMDARLNRSLVRGAGVATALGVAFGGVQLRRMISLEERLERLGISADRSTEHMKKFRDEVNEVASAADVRVDPAEIFSAVEAFTEATGDFDFAEKITREMGLAIQATGSAGEEIGALMASIAQQFQVDTPEDMLAALDLLAKQGKAGAIELGDLAQLGPKVFAAFRRSGQGGIEGILEAGALMQIFKRGVGSAPEAATVFENVITNLGDAKKLKRMEEEGVRTRDENGNRLGPADLLMSLVSRAQEYAESRGRPGDADLFLSNILDAEAMRGVGAMLAMLRETGGYGDYFELRGLRGDGETIKADSARLADTTGASIQSAANNINDAVEDRFMGALKALTDSINALVDEGVKFTLDDAANLAIGGAAGIGLLKGGLWALQGFPMRRRGGKGGAAPEAGGAAGLPGLGEGGVVPVYVTNWRDGGGFGGGDLGDGKGRGRWGRIGGLLNGLGGYAFRMTPLGMAVGAIEDPRYQEAMDQAAARYEAREEPGPAPLFWRWLGDVFDPSDRPAPAAVPRLSEMAMEPPARPAARPGRVDFPDRKAGAEARVIQRPDRGAGELPERPAIRLPDRAAEAAALRAARIETLSTAAAAAPGGPVALAPAPADDALGRGVDKMHDAQQDTIEELADGFRTTVEELRRIERRLGSLAKAGVVMRGRANLRGAMLPGAGSAKPAGPR